MKRKLQLKKTVIRALTKKDINGGVLVRNCNTAGTCGTKCITCPFTCVLAATGCKECPIA